MNPPAEDFTGSDKIRPTSNLSTSDSNGAVIIKESVGLECAPICVPTLLQQITELYPNHVAVVFKQDNQWRTVTYSQLLKNVRIIAKAFLKLGLERYHAVSIMGANTIEWIYANLAAIMAGGLASGIYPTNSPEACLHCMKTASSNIIVVENDYQLQKILKIKDQAPHLKSVVQFIGKPTDPSTLSWSDLIDIGNQEADDKLDRVIKNLAANEACTLLFTSGTTGLPKAVMLSHDNLIFDARMTSTCSGMEYGVERILMYLPLSHIAAQIHDLYTGLVTGSRLYIADRNALSGTSLIDNIRIARPTRFLAVPRVYEKIQEYLRNIEMGKPVLMKYILNKAKSTALKHHIALSNNSRQKYTPSFKYRLFGFMVYTGMKELIGLDQCKSYISGAAPLSSHVRDYLASFDISVGEVYGLSESTGPHLLSLHYYPSCYTSGGWHSAVKTKIDSPDKNGEGEICIWGRHVFMGYLNEPEETHRTFDEDGWLHTGDMGKMINDSWVQVTGRKKEILVTSGGENIPPVLIENNIRAELLPVLSHAVVIGEGKKFLSLLITLKCVVDSKTGVPTDELLPEAVNWCMTVGYPCRTISEITTKKPFEIYNAIQKAIDRVNSNAISSAQRIQKFRILPRDFSLSTGELGPTTKLIRSMVYKNFKEYIESMYLN